jgi:hypothetical protein
VRRCAAVSMICAESVTADGGSWCDVSADSAACRRRRERSCERCWATGSEIACSISCASRTRTADAADPSRVRPRFGSLGARGGTPRATGARGSARELGAPWGLMLAPPISPAAPSTAQPHRRESPVFDDGPRASGGDAGTCLWQTCERAQQRSSPTPPPTKAPQGRRRLLALLEVRAPNRPEERGVCDRRLRWASCTMALRIQRNGSRSSERL